MGKSSRDKGLRTERAIVNLLQGKGFAAERVPLSGAAGGRYTSDVSVPVLGEDLKFEAKCRANGFKEIYSWLEGNDGLIIKADRQPMLVVMRLDQAAEMIMQAEQDIAAARVAELRGAA